MPTSKFAFRAMREVPALQRYRGAHVTYVSNPPYYRAIPVFFDGGNEVLDFVDQQHS
jgi:hypothetical protein